MSRYKHFFDFFKKYQEKIVLTLGFILVAVTSFAAGRLTFTLKSKPIEINDDKSGKNAEKDELVEYFPKTKAEGVYVGEIDSNKYFPIESEEANKISDENKIWFDSASEAEEQGYVLGTSSKDNEDSENDKSSSSKEITQEDVTLGKYVGSKNSNKYHLPDSSAAKRIKEENKVWFQSKEEAEAEGYEPGSSVKEENERN